MFKRDRFWAVEVPVLDIVTQGTSRRDAAAMIADAIEELVNLPGFVVHVFAGSGDEFEIGSSDDAAMTALLLRRARARAGISLAQAAARLGEKSINGYARYEQGRSVPGIRKLSRLYAAVSPACDFVLDECRVRPGRDIAGRKNHIK